jgi:exopolyphosphatase/guanosine-5'-triphosphate,3'-diphosphate pyrophosphatase
MAAETTSPRVVAFMDIGTNSLRLLVVEINHNHSFSVLHQLKETVRLGEGEFSHNRLQQEAMERTIAVVRQFASVARSADADEIIAVATAATREAENQHDFLQRLRDEAGVNVHVVPGVEEARLIYLGVTSSVDLEGRQAFCIDIGGGSTEVGVGNQNESSYLASLKVGAIRLSAHFFSNAGSGPVPERLYEQTCEHVREVSALALHDLRNYRKDVAFGTSGTIENLADIASRMVYGRPWERDDVLSYRDLKRTIRFLCSLPLAERRMVPGLNPARADIIVGGAAILDTVMGDLKLPEIRVSERGLRDGLLFDYLTRHGHSALVSEASVRERSVLQLGRTCRFNEAHARHTARLATFLFDSAKQAQLHSFGDAERELLEYAALLHHIGAFLTQEGYQKHSDYLIRNAELLGFDQTEITTIGALALYHRGSVPRKKDPDLADLDEGEWDAVRKLSTLLRLAESLDRSQTQSVTGALLQRSESGDIALHLSTGDDCHVELRSVTDQRQAFARSFGRPLVITGV